MYTMATRFCEEIHLYGFWPFPLDPQGRSVKYHYYDTLKYEYTSSSSPHTMPLEFRTLSALHRQGALRLHTGTCDAQRRPQKELLHWADSVQTVFLFTHFYETWINLFSVIGMNFLYFKLFSDLFHWLMIFLWQPFKIMRPFSAGVTKLLIEILSCSSVGPFLFFLKRPFFKVYPGFQYGYKFKIKSSEHIMFCVQIGHDTPSINIPSLWYDRAPFKAVVVTFWATRWKHLKIRENDNKRRNVGQLFKHWCFFNLMFNLW